jgi:hypothetical protein
MEFTNMKTKHTPGPWLANVFYGRGTSTELFKLTHGVASQGGFNIAQCTDDKHLSDDYEERQAIVSANTLLIAAAPELLAQLQACLHVLERRLTHPNEPDVTNFEYIKAVIAKATGGAE